MRDEVEEFLKRVAQMRQAAEAQAKAQQQRPKPAAPEPPSQQRAVPPRTVPPQRPAPPQRLVPARQEITYVEPALAEVVEPEEIDRTEGFSRRVAQDLRGSEQIAEHSRRLGEEVDLADDKLAAHLHQVFDHDLGRLKKTASETAATPAAAAASEATVGELLKLLRSPQSIRDAIIMSEVLKRPEDRW